MAVAASAVGPGATAVARVSCGRDLSCVPEVAGTLGAVARQGDTLQAAVSQEEQQLATSCKILSNYETLGPEFEELVKEYARLQAIIENRRWVLTEFNKD
ncbi:HAUS augmin-like complex subunit 4 [Rhineura floridana]|uniref:HAUS augmin-like complex subunit 4 n=1 Tax=Rhineura floridana TaxID=261503 RepID=UPI002AC83B56|nr:HAUS augmin-like complex subunit 4 [Rhineura floridana]